MVDSIVLFRGEIKKLHASNNPVAGQSEGLCIVRVTELLRPNGIDPKLVRVGTEITVNFAHPEVLKLGEIRLVAAEPWLVGPKGEIALTEAKGLVDAARVAELGAELERLKTALADARLAARLAGADLIVTGSVSRVDDVPFKGPISEHAPLWQRATG